MVSRHEVGKLVCTFIKCKRFSTTYDQKLSLNVMVKYHRKKEASNEFLTKQTSMKGIKTNKVN